jgi:hypothetical protein
VAGLAAAGRTDRIVLSRLDGDELVDVERWTGRNRALPTRSEAPISDRFGSFAGQPLISGAVIWTAADHRVVTKDAVTTASRSSCERTGGRPTTSDRVRVGARAAHPHRRERPGWHPVSTSREDTIAQCSREPWSCHLWLSP